MAVLLVGFHAMVVVGTQPSLDLHRISDLFAIIVRILFLSHGFELILVVGSIITGVR